jgi:hypothetical protein
MTMAPHSGEVHHMVDQLSSDQIEALYMILRGMLTASGTARETDRPAPSEARGAGKPRFSFIGIMEAEPDLAARSAQILRDELGNAIE